MYKTIKELDIYISDGNYSSKYPRSEEFVNEGIPFIRGNNMLNGEIIDEDMYFITSEKHSVLLKGHVKSGDVLITTRGNIGQVAIVPERHEDSNINAQIVLLRVNPNVLYNRYLLWVLQSQNAKDQFETLQTGTALKQLPVGKLEQIKIKYKNLEEQHFIATVLDGIYWIINQRRRELEELDNLIKARFVELFGDPKYNKSNLVKIGEIGVLTSGGTPSRTKPEYFEGNIRWYSAGELNSLYLPDSVEHISETALQQSAAKLFNKGTLMIGMYDTAAFKMGILTEDSSSNQACANLNPKQGYDVIWLYYLFDIMKPIFLQERQGVRQKNLSLSKIKEFEVPIAPFELQEQFAAFVEQTDKSKVAVQKALDEAQLLFDSLMQEYFG